MAEDFAELALEGLITPKFSCRVATTYCFVLYDLLINSPLGLNVADLFYSCKSYHQQL